MRQLEIHPGDVPALFLKLLLSKGKLHNVSTHLQCLAMGCISNCRISHKVLLSLKLRSAALMDATT
jgi:hypothetical protein